ncbi:hypothetical protein CBM2609_B120152 [Cupriavidus taiwanensis]|nr:hypothetical protein CBM2604_B130153 [Cupriavidus taiwanensis]SOZ31193.1 hypothetical protein CBM2609_B120152 [Cupriavidus taiwanensis]SOZ47270.1 hypothetical protein CBM2610_B100152 [Cupriavidus taiwanensis]SPA02176.1 hypothetical protein CBM2626_B140074 [Cupriavidus taiwanensis]
MNTPGVTPRRQSRVRRDNPGKPKEVYPT